MENLRNKIGFICDMDGVIYHGNRLLPGVKEFVEWLYRENKRFLFLTNSSERTPRELQQKLARMGLEVDESHFYTSALATAQFLKTQAPGCSAYVIGAPGLYNALYQVGITKANMGMASAVGLTLLALVLAVNLIQLVLMGFFRKEDA